MLGRDSVWYILLPIVSRIVRGGIVIKPWCIQGQPIYSGYFELTGCGTIGQVWVTAIAVAISLTALFSLGKRNAVMTLIFFDDDDINVEDSGGDSQARICFCFDESWQRLVPVECTTIHTGFQS